uniref:Uncharacterized protein n=1 Tax=Arundo donax TaxID=35708 RepID=A0A0A9A6U2_ARUDO
MAEIAGSSACAPGRRQVLQFKVLPD